MITRKLRMWCPSSNRAEDIFRGAWVAIRALVAIGMLIPACGKTTKSQPVRYNIYIGGGYNPSVSPGYLYVIDADSLSVLDSIPGFPSVRNVLISPDGRSAFLGVSYRRAATYDLLKIDLRSKELVDRYPNSDCALHLSSADSGRLLVGGRYCNQVIDPRTFARLYTAPDSLDLWHGPEGGTQVAAMPRDMGTRVYGFDLRTGAVSGYYEPHLTSGDPVDAYTTCLHPDERRILVIGPRSSLYDSWFLIGDILTGATLLEHPLVYPFGEITISGNGAIATVTDPSRALLWDSRQTLDVFDLNSMTHLKRFVQSLEGFECAGQVRFLPGDETVVSAPGIRGWGPIQLINLKTMSVEKTSYLPNVEADIGALAVGRRPQ